MTENEAIERLQCMRLFMEIEDKNNESKFLEDDYIANKIAIQTLEEIQQYRAIGTPTQIYEKIGGLDVELGKYRAIGTIEEFKALKEREEPKRLVTREERYPKGYGLYSTADRWCPCCKGLVFTNDWSIDKQKIMYKRSRCSCGQRLDWSE